MRALGISAAVHPTDGHPVVVGEVAGRSARRLLFYNHYDVQPADPVHEWISPPFEPTVRQGRLYARGATDNKGNIVSRLMAVKALASGGALPVTAKFLFEGEEEIGSPSLPAWVKSHVNLLAAEGCVWEDTFRDDADVATITLGNKGMCYLELECETASVDLHSSYAGVYPSAAWRLLDALATLRAPGGRVAVAHFYDDVAHPDEGDRRLLDRLPPMNLEADRERFGLTSLPIADGRAARLARLTQPTCNLAGVEAGYAGEGAKTIIPRRATAKVDCRLVPDQDPDRIFELIAAHLVRHGYGDIRVRHLHGTPPSKTPPGRLTAVMEAAARSVYGRPAVVEPYGTGSTPNWIISRLVGIPVAATGIGVSGSNTHGPNESVGIEDLRKGILYMANIMRGYAG
jgi:acetylornithine deacetylase/succinyl-diaminopimelate desuccinylase-like protein